MKQKYIWLDEEGVFKELSDEQVQELLEKDATGKTNALYFTAYHKHLLSEIKTLKEDKGEEADKKADKVVKQRKQHAKESAQLEAMSGTREPGVAEEARQKLRSGDLTGLLQNWGKYGSVFKR